MFFLVKATVAVAVIAALIRGGMHAQQLRDEGKTPWSSSGIEAVSQRLQVDVERFVRIAD